LAASLEFVTTDPHERSALAYFDDRATNHQFQRAHVLQKKGPGNANLHLNSLWRGAIRLKTKGFMAEIGGNAASQMVAFPGRKTEFQLALVSFERPPVPGDNVLMASHNQFS
jgi:hypothetical protein